MSQLNVIKEVAGTRVYWPAQNVATLTGLEPGKGYWVSVTGEITVNYPDCQENNFVPRPPVEIPNTTSWNDVHFTAVSHLVSISAVVLNEAGLRPSDIIGIFTPNGLCAGFIGWDGYNDIAATAFADDELTAVKDGFYAREPLKFKVFRSGKDEEFNLSVTFDAGMPDQGSFKANGISAISGAALVPNSIDGPAVLDFSVFPNPSDGIFSVYFKQANASLIEIHHISGPLMKSFPIHQTESGSFDLDLSEFKGGIYILKLITPDAIGIQKIVIR
jgi:hypothetical protein